MSGNRLNAPQPKGTTQPQSLTCTPSSEKETCNTQLTPHPSPLLPRPSLSLLACTAHHDRNLKPSQRLLSQLLNLQPRRPDLPIVRIPSISLSHSSFLIPICSHMFPSRSSHAYRIASIPSPSHLNVPSLHCTVPPQNPIYCI